MSDQGKDKYSYPRIWVTAEVKEAVTEWAKANSFKPIKISELIAKIPQIKQHMKASE